MIITGDFENKKYNLVSEGTPTVKEVITGH
jgi:hypothetical protein